MTPAELAAMIDHTILKPEALAKDVDKIVDEAIASRFWSVCVAPPFVAHVARRLKGSGVKTCTVIGFPNGTHKSTIKAIEASSTIKDGADEIDIVAHLPHLIEGNFEAARDELMEVVRSARATRPDVLIKVIVESAALLAVNKDRQEQTIALACRAVTESGCDYIKTSTGFHPAGGAQVQAVQWMHKHGKGAIKVKASGGIRDLTAALQMIEAGASRLGLSASTAIVNELRAAPADAATQASGY